MNEFAKRFDRAGPCWVLALAAVMLVSACDGGENQVCEPGGTQSCVCSSGDQGAQTCKPDGSGWTACACDGTGGDDAGPTDLGDVNPRDCDAGGCAEVDAVRSTGMIAPANACGALGKQGGATTKLRFAMIGEDGRPMYPASKGGRLAAGDQVVTSAGTGSVFEHPDLQCGTDGSGGGGGEDGSYKRAILSYDGSCGSAFECAAGANGGDAAMKRCRRDSDYQVEGLDHVANAGNAQLFGVLVENAGSLEGFPPGEAGSWYYDADADGTADAEVQPQSRKRATDPDGQRVRALRSLVANWKRAGAAARKDGRSSLFGLWTFAGSATPESMVDEATADDTVWTDNPEEAENVVSGEVYPSRSEAGTRGNVLEAAHALLKNQYSAERVAGTDKTLVVFTDGPPEVHPDRHGVTADKVIQAADSAGVRLFIVHLDAPVGDGSAESVLDDVQYYRTQEEQCGSPADCRPHETCREVRGYSTRANGDVTAGTTGRYHDRGEGATFCMPQRRADGRTGPLALYAKIACATEGGYQYVKTNRDIGWAMSWLPAAMDGLWEADVSVQQLARDDYTPESAIRLEAAFEVEAGNRTLTLDLSQTGGNRVSGRPASGDSRSVVVTGQ